MEMRRCPSKDLSTRIRKIELLRRRIKEERT
jgi:hypothetical protein